LKTYYADSDYGFVYVKQDCTVQDGTATGHTFKTTDRIYVHKTDMGIIQDMTLKSTLVGLDVEFKVFKNDKGYTAFEVTGPNGSGLAARQVKKDDIVLLENGKRFTGTVVKCKLNKFVLIKSEDPQVMQYYKDDPKKENVFCYCEEIATDERPARCDENQKVTFQLERQGEKNVRGINIASEHVQKIVCAPRQTLADKYPRQYLGNGKRFSGVVKSFNWTTGVGWVHTDDALPDDVKTAQKKENGNVYFHREDLNSRDKVFGVPLYADVEFSFYTDNKGLGACNISRPFGEPFENVIIGAGKRGGNNNRWKGQRRWPNKWKSGSGTKRKLVESAATVGAKKQKV